jgi:hypothetical protein
MSLASTFEALISDRCSTLGSTGFVLPLRQGLLPPSGRALHLLERFSLVVVLAVAARATTVSLTRGSRTVPLTPGTHRLLLPLPLLLITP